jgi:SARP family transcriptional regulator, regulator of embCAB operon
VTEQRQGSTGLLDAQTTIENGEPADWPWHGYLLHFEALGPLEIHNGSRVYTPTAHKIRVLLAIFLVRANTLVPIDSLIHELWGESPPRTALKALRVYVSQLRRVLDELPFEPPRPVLVTRDPGYRLDIDAGTLDIIEFERLCGLGRRARHHNRLELAARYYREALGLWRGPALIDVRSGPLLESTALFLEEERTAILERRIDLDIRLNRHGEVIAELRTLTAEHPLHERAHTQLMIALYLAGRKADALETYRSLRGSLVEELGVEPSHKLRLLHQAILGADDQAVAQWDSWTW